MREIDEFKVGKMPQSFCLPINKTILKEIRNTINRLNVAFKIIGYKIGSYEIGKTKIPFNLKRIEKE